MGWRGPGKAHFPSNSINLVLEARLYGLHSNDIRLSDGCRCRRDCSSRDIGDMGDLRDGWESWDGRDSRLGRDSWGAGDGRTNVDHRSWPRGSGRLQRQLRTSAARGCINSP